MQPTLRTLTLRIAQQVARSGQPATLQATGTRVNRALELRLSMDGRYLTTIAGAPSEVIAQATQFAAELREGGEAVRLEVHLEPESLTL